MAALILTLAQNIQPGRSFVMSVLKVGAKEYYTNIASAVSAAKSGDTIEIDAGHYKTHDILLTKSLTIEAAGNGPVVLQQSRPLAKGMLIAGSNTAAPNITIEGLTFTGATSPSKNGTGIRYQSGNLTLINDTFSNSQDGLLATPFVANTGTIIVQGSTFDHNGMANGLGHNIYIGDIANFVMTNSVSEDAVVGHEVKSRAFNNTIENNLIKDGPTGTSSYDIDIPNGGNALIQGNTIEQGPKSQNPWMIAYGEEGKLHPGSLTVTDNLILNDRSGGRGIWNRTATPASIINNDIFGLSSSTLLKGPDSQSGNVMLSVEPALGSSPGGSSSMSFITSPSSSSSSVGTSTSRTSLGSSLTQSSASVSAVAAGAVGPSDFLTNHGNLQPVPAASIASSAGSGLYLDPMGPSQMILAHGS